jgi:hypothetical protein
MAFTWPNAADAAFAAQARLFQTDIDILVVGMRGVGIIDDGCAVTPSGAADHKVNVAGGVAAFGTSGSISVTAGQVTLSVPDSSQPRVDLVWVNSTGTLGKTDGVAAAKPVPPALPASTAALAMVHSPAVGGATVASTWVTDKRVELSTDQSADFIAARMLR